MNPEDVKTIPRLVEDGLTVKQIAEKFSANPKTITNWIKKLRKAGYDVRTRRGRRPMKL